MVPKLNFIEPFKLFLFFGKRKERKTLKFIKKLKKKMEEKVLKFPEKNTNSNSIIIIVFLYHFEIKERKLFDGNGKTVQSD